jgi:hypothetical protein
MRFFYIKLHGEVIWRFPNDTKRELSEIFQVLYGWEFEKTEKEFALFPITSIIKYLDLPKDRLLDYEDHAGLSDILKICDKRICYNRLKNIELSPAAKKIFDARFKNKHESC